MGELLNYENKVMDDKIILLYVTDYCHVYSSHPFVE